MSDTRNPDDHGGRNDPEHRVGRGGSARRRIAVVAITVVLIIFAALLTIWLLGRSTADAQAAAEIVGLFVPAS